MKKILVLTDFSKNSKNAAAIGVFFSSKLNTDLLLFNSYVTNSVAPVVSEPWMLNEVIWGDDENKDSLNKQAMQLRGTIDQLAANNAKPVVYCETGEGKLGNIVQEITRKENIELVIMGARAEKPDDDGVFGSDINSVIEKSRRPILIIPPGADAAGLNKMIFATEMNGKDMEAIKYLAKLAGQLNFKLEVVHVSAPDEIKSSAEKTKSAHDVFITYLNHLNINYTESNGHNVAELLMENCKEKGAGLLAVMHHQRPALSRIFHKSTTKSMLNKQMLPLMVFPSKME